ncbi:MAG: hypothetical protein IJL26_03185 [Clostridia bacterium]|nr:hypothetical protein [Clostridia bacterium]
MERMRDRKQIRYSLMFFLFLTAYTLTVPCRFSLPAVSEALYAFHVVDFSAGFCSKLLPGAVFRFFVKNPTIEAACAFDCMLLLLFFLGTALLLGVRAKTFLDASGNRGMLFLFFFLCGPATFSVYASEPGFVDFYWLLFGLLFLLFLPRRSTLFFLLPLPALCVLTHFSAMLCAVPFFVILLLYRFGECADGKERALVALVGTASIALALALFFYLLLHEKSNLVYSMEEFDRILQSRGVKVTSYFDYVFYDGGETVRRVAQSGYAPMTAVGGGLFEKAFAAVKNQFLWNVALLDKAGWRILPGRAALLLLISPVVGLLFVFIRRRVRAETVKTKKLALSLSPMLFFLTLICGMLFSTDYSRWIALAVLPAFTFVLYVCFRETQFAAEYLRDVFTRVPRSWQTVYAVVYALTVIPPTDWA